MVPGFARPGGGVGGGAGGAAGAAAADGPLDGTGAPCHKVLRRGDGRGAAHDFGETRTPWISAASVRTCTP